MLLPEQKSRARVFRLRNSSSSSHGCRPIPSTSRNTYLGTGLAIQPPGSSSFGAPLLTCFTDAQAHSADEWLPPSRSCFLPARPPATTPKSSFTSSPTADLTKLSIFSVPIARSTHPHSLLTLRSSTPAPAVPPSNAPSSRSHLPSRPFRPHASSSSC